MSTIAPIHARSTIAAAALALFVPVVLLVNGIAVIGHPWFVRAEFAVLGGERDAQLADQALEAAMPWGKGEGALDDSYDTRERTHLADVRVLLTALLGAHVFGALALAGLALWRPAIAGAALRYGLFLTFGIAAFAAIYVLLSPVSFLGGFHRLFFEGDSWRFAEDDNLRILFPDRFWAHTAIVLGVLTGAQAIALAVADRVRRQASRRTARTPTA